MILLVVIILGSIVYIYFLDNAANNLISMIEKLEDTVKADDWEEAQKQLDNLQKEWKKTERWMTTLVDHQEIDTIKITLSKLSQYVDFKKTADFMAESTTLKLLIEHIPGKEKCNISNLL
ncbi:MAG: hypothetical protein PWP27_526 [Clostridiales bacterium]|nr:hypothetical protein [Clostridiales bacterium]MDK2932716.1 hypothetical protein [Clostridiales bacterium]